MTREEAKKQGTLIELSVIVDKIYDDFESRTCENCKFFLKKQRLCRKDVYIFGETFIKNKFGCNKFERK